MQQPSPEPEPVKEEETEPTPAHEPEKALEAREVRVHDQYDCTYDYTYGFFEPLQFLRFR